MVVNSPHGLDKLGRAQPFSRPGRGGPCTPRPRRYPASGECLISHRAKRILSPRFGRSGAHDHSSGLLGRTSRLLPAESNPLGGGSLVAKGPRRDELVPWTGGLDGDSGETAGTFYTGRVRAVEVSEVALARLKDLLAAADALGGRGCPLAAGGIHRAPGEELSPEARLEEGK